MRKLALLLLVACSPDKSNLALGAPCATTRDCSSGQLCVDRHCIKPQCVANADCASGVCTASYLCEGEGTAGGISIVSIASDLPNNRVSAALKVTGTGFDGGVTAQILTADLATMLSAVVTVASATELSVTLPTEIAAFVTSATDPRTFSLRLSSTTTGSATRELGLLKGADGSQGPMGPAGTYQLPIVATGYSDAGVPAIFASNDASSGTAVSASAPNGGTAIRAHAPGGTALSVTAGNVDLSAASGVRLPIYVKEFVSNDYATVVQLWAYCNVGDTLIGGGCHRNGGPVNISKLRVCARPDTSANPTFTSAPGTCPGDFGNSSGSDYVSGPAQDNAADQAFWLCNHQAPNTQTGQFFAQAICLRGF